MALFKSGNPALSENRFRDTVLDQVVNHENAMTVKGTLNKFGFLFLMTLGTAYYSWKEAVGGGDAWTLVLIGVFGGLGVGLVMAFKKQWSPYLAPLYALLEGLFVGAVSAFFEYRFSSGDTTRNANVDDSLTTIDKYNISFINSKLNGQKANTLAAK